MIPTYKVLLRLTNRDVLMGESDRSAAEIIQSQEPVTLTAASYVKRKAYSEAASGNGDDRYNTIEVSRESIAFAVDL